MIKSKLTNLKLKCLTLLSDRKKRPNFGPNDTAVAGSFPKENFEYKIQING